MWRSTIPTKTRTAAAQTNLSNCWSKRSPRACKHSRRLRPNPPRRMPPKFPPRERRPSDSNSIIPFLKKAAIPAFVSQLDLHALCVPLECLPRKEECDLGSGLGAFAKIACQPKKGEIQAGAEDVMFDFFGGEMLADFAAHGGQERFHRCGVAFGRADNLLRNRRPAVQPIAELRDVLGRILRKPK